MEEEEFEECSLTLPKLAISLSLSLSLLAIQYATLRYFYALETISILHIIFLLRELKIVGNIEFSEFQEV